MKKRTVWLLGLLLLLGLVIMGDSELFPLVLLVIGALLVFWALKGKGKKPTDKQVVPTLSKEKEAHYVESGMSASEITFFRDTMNQAKEQINLLQKNINNNAKLKTIDLRHDTLRAAKAMFKELVKDPQKLHAASHFLYTHLPNMVELTNTFIEINDHEIKSKETYEKIEESAQIIDQMAALISQDYQQFVADDLAELDVELSIAKQSLKRDNN
ncbi:MAG: 5-bromo-4-chloroindolyl phosphate hydrolysis family protein [Enterococcus sp.]